MLRLRVEGLAPIVALERARSFDDGTLTNALNGSDAALARRAALAIGRTKHTSEAPLLVAKLTSRDPGLRAVATFALGLIGSPDDLDAVRGEMSRDPSSAVRYAAADAVGRIVAQHPLLATASVADALLDVARADSDAIVRAHAAIQLDVFAKISSAPRTERALEAALASERVPEVRWHEMWVLYRAYAAMIDSHFLAAQLQSPDELVRVEAVRAVGKRHDPGAAHFVRPLVADPSWRVQLQARETLLALDGKPPTQHLTSFPPALNLPAIPPATDAMTPIPLPPLPEPTAPRKGARRSPAPSSAVPSPDVTPAAPAAPAPAPQFSVGPPPASALLAGPALDPTTAASMNRPMPGRHPRVRLHTTRGDIVVRLWPEWAPVTVANFLQLTAIGYYDNNRWFRVVPDFVAQTGEPTNDPDHDAGYTIGAEENPVEQRSGIIAMAMNYDKTGHAVRDSAATEFYFTDSPQLHLGRDFSVFGEIERGADVLANLVESDRILTARRIDDD